jgi:Na+-driven multidrug efflux pump
MNDTAKFVQGKLMRHIIVMSSTSAVGLMSIFFVDLLDMFFISLLGDPDLVAGIGIAGTLTFNWDINCRGGFSIKVCRR